MESKIGCVVVCYQPQEDLVERLRSTARCFGTVILVDNGSSGESWNAIRRGLEALDNVTLIANPANLGQARALNQGLEACRRQGFAWAMTLDQDSWFTPWFVEQMLVALEHYEPKEKLAILAPCIFDPVELSFRPFKGRSIDARYLQVSMTITSGGIMNLRQAEIIGMFREDYFIDWVDHEYCLRCRMHGLDLIVTLGAVLVHTIGERRESRLLFYRRYTSHQAPVRHYYLVRNSIRTYLEYRRRVPGWGRRELRRVMRQARKVLLLEPGRRRNMAMMTRGLIDGIKGRMGPCAHRG